MASRNTTGDVMVESTASVILPGISSSVSSRPKQVAPATMISSVADVHTALIERIVEADEALMEEYLENGEIDPAKLSPVISKAIADGVQEGLLALPEKHKPWHVEGADTLRWVLADYVHVVVHVFRRETREYYALERFWGDAPSERVEDEPPVPGGAR